MEASRRRLLGSLSRAGTNAVNNSSALLVGGLRSNLFSHAGLLEVVAPPPAQATVAVPDVLPEVVGAVELLRLVAVAELVALGEMLDAALPLRGKRELFPAVAAFVGGVWAMP